MKRRCTRRAFVATLALIGPVMAACSVASPGSVAPAAAPTGNRAGTSPTQPADLAAASSAGATGAVVFGASSEVRSLNPLLANDGASTSVTALLFEGLVRPDAQTGAPVPLLAERWDQSADGLTYTFHLRPEVTWSDGQPFTADDVQFTFDTIRNAKTQTPYRSQLNAVASYAIQDPSTFSVTLKQPFCPFLINLAQIPLVPKHVLSGSADINNDDFGLSRPVGTGPYVFKEWRTNEQLTLVANPTYWQGAPKIGQWIRKVVNDDNVAIAQLKTGELDYASVVQPELAADLRQDPNLSVLSYASPVNAYLAYNLDRPLLQDTRVRQALAYALDRAQIVDKLLVGEGQVLNSPILPQSWAYNPNVPTYDYNPQMAQELLRQAGWTRGADGILQKEGNALRFTLMTNSGNKLREAVLTIVQDAWSKIGAQVQPQFLEFAAFTDKFQKAHDFDAVLAGATVPIDPDQTSTWSTQAFNGGENYVGYSNPTVDALLEQARTVPGCDQAARKVLYDQIQQLIADDQPYTFLYTPKTIIVFNKRVRNVTPNVWALTAGVTWNIKDWTLQ